MQHLLLQPTARCPPLVSVTNQESAAAAGRAPGDREVTPFELATVVDRAAAAHMVALSSVPAPTAASAAVAKTAAKAAKVAARHAAHKIAADAAAAAAAAREAAAMSKDSSSDDDDSDSSKKKQVLPNPNLN